MAEKKGGDISKEAEKRALEVTEEAREDDWNLPSFAGDLFMGRLNMDQVFPFPRQSEDDLKAGDAIIAKLKPFLEKELNADEVDKKKEIPQNVIEGFKKLGLFGIKIPKEYGGLGLGQYNYGRIIELISSHCGSTAVFLSAHQSIGVPQPLKLFGTDKQKKKYLPRLAKGEISAFALTEPGVGSDPSRMTTTATPTKDGKHYLINGEKLWISNGPIADILVVMARTPTDDPEKTKITAFIVEKGTKGFETKHRCSFLGLNGLNNGLLSFKDVNVPAENIILGEGKGLKLALVTLNTGRLTLPAGSSGVAKQCLAIIRTWANERHQWGAPIGRHEAVAEKIAAIASDTFAIESIAWLTSAMADAGKADIRLEAAMAKLFSTERLWSIIDQTLQIRGGRGYETADSLRDRGEYAAPVERMLRDARINTIIEGTTDIMHLFIAREALDPHMKIAKLSPLTGKMDMAAAAKYYVTWYPKLWIMRNSLPESHSMTGTLKGHLKYLERGTRRLARDLFHAMIRYQAALEKKQRLLGRIVDIGTELFAISAVISRAQMLYEKNRDDKTPIELADTFCKQSRRRIKDLHCAVYCNDDKSEYRFSRKFLDGEFAWLEDGIISTWKEEKKPAAKKAAPKTAKKAPVKKTTAAKGKAKTAAKKPAGRTKKKEE
ncbi:MAG: acyl-CoA dehydrogenase family protein [bacterium]|nr:acyl-CoA dehydrogenase family protein [bacterium]